jgi:CRP-like cAMP-binding protein
MATLTPAVKALFARHYLFGQLSSLELDMLVARARIERYRVGQTVFVSQSEGRGMMAVLSGRVRISAMSRDGRELVLNSIEAGEVFGELALLDGKERTADAVAALDSELLVLERREFVPFLEEHPLLAMRLLAIVTERLRQTTAQATEIALLRLESRLAKQLLKLLGGQGAVVNGAVVGARLTQRQLGQMVGASRESVNKQFADWQRRGIAQFRAGTITVINAAALRDLAVDV